MRQFGFYIATALALMVFHPDAARAKNLEFPKAALVGSSGANVAFDPSFFDADVTVVSFTYLDCKVTCPGSIIVMRQLDEAAAKLDKSIELVTISIDANNDTPIRLAKRREELAASSKWNWYLGSTADIRAIAGALGAKNMKQSHHDSDYFLVSREGLSVRRLRSAQGKRLTTSEDVLDAVQTLSK
jgi:cytochrome oxidase Cu insertion factor (SCO1/SenC/PrrC family)